MPSRRELVFVGGLTLVAGWAALSALWSAGAGAPVLDAERGVLYVAAAAAALLLLALPGAAPGLLGGVVAGAVALSLYGLATDCFQDMSAAPTSRGGLPAGPAIGYANALAMVVVVGILLSVGFTAHGGLRVRVAGAISLVVLLPTLYFTVSRGAIGALVAGFIVQALIDPRRRRLLTVRCSSAAPAALAVLILARDFPDSRRMATNSKPHSVTARGFALILVVLASSRPLASICSERRDLRSPARLSTPGRNQAVFLPSAVALGGGRCRRSPGTLGE